MHGMSIQYKEHRRCCFIYQTAKKFAELRSIDLALHHHKAHLSLGTDSRDQIKTESRSCRSNNRSLAFRSPSFTGMKIRSYPSLISKEDISAGPLSLSTDRWILLFQPFLDQRRILLESAHQWLLAGQSQLSQQPSHGCQAKICAILLVDQSTNHCTRPKCKFKLELQWVLECDGIIDPLHLRTRDLSRTTIEWLSSEGVPTARAISGKPLIDTAPRKSQGFYNCFGAFAGLNLFNGTNSYCFQRLMIQFAGIVFDHAQLYHMSAYLCTD